MTWEQFRRRHHPCPKNKIGRNQRQWRFRRRATSKLEQGRYGPVYPKTPACYGFTIIAKIKPGREEHIRAYGKTIEKAIADIPDALATLKLHYLRWVLFDIGKETYFMYQGIFDTDFDKYTEDAVALFRKSGGHGF